MDIFKQLTKNLSFAKENKQVHLTTKTLNLVTADKSESELTDVVVKTKKRKLEEDETKFNLIGSVPIETNSNKKKKKNEIQKVEQIKIEHVIFLKG
jgi:hypothetical protein